MSAFEADRFNHSRTSPRRTTINCRIPRAYNALRISVSDSPLRRAQGDARSTPYLTAAPKERLQHFRAAAGQHPAANLDRMVQPRMIQDLHHRAHRPRFGVVRAINQTPNPSMHHRARAHGARFNCNKQVAAFQTMVTHGSTSFPQSDDFRVSRGIVICDVPIPSLPHDPTVANDDRSHWNFSCFEGALGAPQGFFHPQLVRSGLRALIFGAKGISCGYLRWRHEARYSEPFYRVRRRIAELSVGF